MSTTFITIAKSAHTSPIAFSVPALVSWSLPVYQHSSSSTSEEETNGIKFLPPTAWCEGELLQIDRGDVQT